MQLQALKVRTVSKAARVPKQQQQQKSIIISNSKGSCEDCDKVFKAPDINLVFNTFPSLLQNEILSQACPLIERPGTQCSKTLQGFVFSSREAGLSLWAQVRVGAWALLLAVSLQFGEGHGLDIWGLGLWVFSGLSRNVPLPKEIIHSALCFTYREWSLLPVRTASCLRIPMEKPWFWFPALVWAGIWLWASWGCHWFTRNTGVDRWTPWEWLARYGCLVPTLPAVAL